MTKFRLTAIAALVLTLSLTLAITACGQDSTPELTAATQPPQATPSPQPPTPTAADSTPISTPISTATAYARSPIPRPSGFAPPSPDPTPIPEPTPTPTTTPIPSTPPLPPTPATATPTPITSTPTPTATATAQPTLASQDPYDDLNVITLLPKDGIPAILDPTFLSAAEAWDQYLPDEAVLGVSINGEHKAYSVPYLSNREIVNDELGGVAIAATW